MPLLRAMHAHLGHVLIVHTQIPEKQVVLNFWHRMPLNGAYQELPSSSADFEPLLWAVVDHALNVRHRGIQHPQVDGLKHIVHKTEPISPNS